MSLIDVLFRQVTSDRSILLKIKTDACAGTEYAVNYLEHVQAVISVNATRRGDLELFLTSPMGTRWVNEFPRDHGPRRYHRRNLSRWKQPYKMKIGLRGINFRSMILSRRVNDNDHRDGFTKWPFMTTHTWGEYPQGTWLLEVNFEEILVCLFRRLLVGRVLVWKTCMSFRWASTLKHLSVDGFENGPWCCTAPENHPTPDFRRPILTRSWRLSKKLTRNDRQLCNDALKGHIGTFISRDIFATSLIV